MVTMNVVLQGDGVLKDTDPNKIVHLQNTITLASLDNGMASGKPSVAFIFDLPDGRKVLAETSMTLFLSAAKIFSSHYKIKDE